MDDRNFALIALAILVFNSASVMAKAWMSPFLSFDYIFFTAGSAILLSVSVFLLHDEVLRKDQQEQEYQMDSLDYKFIIESLEKSREQADPETIDLSEEEEMEGSDDG